MPNSVQTNNGVSLVIQALLSIKDAPEMLVFNPGTPSVFIPKMTPDLVLEPGFYHGGNPLIEASIRVKSCANLNISVDKKETLSTEHSKGLFDVEYPVTGQTNGQVKYFWDEVYSTPVGIYSVTNVDPSTVTGWNIKLDKEQLTMQTNDVNIIPREGDYIIFNEVPISFTNYQNGNLNNRLPIFKGMELLQAKILEVVILGGTGSSIKFSIRLDKSYTLQQSSTYSVVLLNRMNTSIQKELFYDTFEQVEIHRQQLLGDPYNNTTDVNKPQGRKNFLYYSGHEALGMRNLLKGIINEKDTPFVIFDINDNVKDRFSFYQNTYDANGNPQDTHFEMHLPGVMINDNLYSLDGSASVTPVDSNGNILENIFVASPKYLTDTNGIGKYSGLYLKQDTKFTKRFGWVCFDLRIVVIDHEELATALGYNSNRNYTLPRPVMDPNQGNSLPNLANGVNLDITGASNQSPIVITTNTPHNLKRGAKVVIKNVQGNTAANGEYFVDTINDAYKFQIWQQMPQYNPGGVKVDNTGVPVTGNGNFVNNGAGNSGKIIQALPAYSYFFTYRIRDKHAASTLPYAERMDFNFTRGAGVDNEAGSLYFNIPTMYFAYGVSGNFGFRYDDSNIALYDFGIDVIIGEYDRNPLDPVAPNKIIGLKNIMVLPANKLTTVPVGSYSTGIQVVVSKINDYKKAIDDTANLVGNNTYDIYNVKKHYDYNVNTLPETLWTGAGKWTIGEFIYRNHVNLNRAQLTVHVPADKWNGTKNPSYRPSQNDFIREKYISEVAILLDDQGVSTDSILNKPMIYTKISPAVKKSNILDIILRINLDF